MITVRLLQRWNEHPMGARIQVTYGQADILFARGVAALEHPEGRKAKRGSYANPRKYISKSK